MYHSWIYIHLLNTPWFLWGVTLLVFGFNLTLPFIVWYLFSSRRPRLPLFLRRRKSKKTNPA